MSFDHGGRRNIVRLMSSVIELTRNVDLLVHEATFLEYQLSIVQLTKHSTAGMAGGVGKEAHAKRLVLFHKPPPNEHKENEFHNEAMDAYGDELQIGTHLTTIKF
jgi:ribonuclease Z